MRRKMELVLCFVSCDEGLPQVIRDDCARYRAISQVRDDNVRADNVEVLSAVRP
jgi:hypothetical protein